ncbi:hypothetical protein [Flavilitoribacter nigricans]|uniref:Prolyl 4-hydroxylase alpha subunit Fe(2+) 2OG dioxygenase domain-containing protein n=1 Tax=Flavilitoribacter nigricans (strain ATCC 23147 / DSM 23189 / NBRC 102662 / NCIMB 1420 / SS-2) TaxID=1122177 RepID=A0A2D0NCJ3_FLAN2|nr:hypothetical protein [Flavilitoribacter nigricans]PHN05899.1 hypothetical protein CRP01_13025 [Flavilitoribacter nigricans DSM 23189 = NBRC 102662]
METFASLKPTTTSNAISTSLTAGAVSDQAHAMDKTADRPEIPQRPTPAWMIKRSLPMRSREDMRLLATGHLPLGILPDGLLLPSFRYRRRVVDSLRDMQAARYDNTDAGQRVESWGKPLVDAPSLDAHLRLSVDERIQAISDPFVDRIREWLTGLGYRVEDLIDPLTGMKYHAGILRQISVSKSNSVLHVDDFVRDGRMKPDFRLPEVLRGQHYYQISFNLLLEDGGHQADPLYCYNRFYRDEDESYCLANGWQFPAELMEDAKYYRYQPKVGEAYVFSTTAYHDIFGGSPLSNRITWSVFGIYVPSKNLMLLYN